MSTYIYRSAKELANLIKNGEATSTEILTEHLAQIKKHNPSLHAVVLLLENEAMETASMCDREAKAGKFRGPLHGVPMTRTPEDLELVWNIIKGPHKTDPSVPPVDWNRSKPKKLADYKIAWVDGWPGFESSPETQKMIKEFVELIDSNGGNSTNALPKSDIHERSLSVYRRLSFQMILQDVPWIFKPLIMGSLKRGFLKGMKEIHWKFRDSLMDYSQLMGQRAKIIKEWEEYFEEYDLLICPSGNGPAFPRCKIGTPISFSGKTLKYLEYVWPYNACFNASGHPSMTLPLGIGNGGLPVGVQIVGPYWSEMKMLSFAKLISEFTSGFVKPEGY